MIAGVRAIAEQSWAKDMDWRKPHCRAGYADLGGQCMIVVKSWVTIAAPLPHKQRRPKCFLAGVNKSLRSFTAGSSVSSSRSIRMAEYRGPSCAIRDLDAFLAFKTAHLLS